VNIKTLQLNLSFPTTFQVDTTLEKQSRSDSSYLWDKCRHWVSTKCIPGCQEVSLNRNNTLHCKVSLGQFAQECRSSTHLSISSSLLLLLVLAMTRRCLQGNLTLIFFQLDSTSLLRIA
jgi:hypothetical protein